jgi:predicted PurR-regulated permease PerM
MKENQSDNSVYEVAIKLAILAFIMAWCFMIILPFVMIMLWSIILAVAMFPLHKIISKKLGDSPKIASTILVFTFLIIVFIPIGFMIGSLVQEVKVLKTMYNEGTLTIPTPNESVQDWPVVGKKVYGLWQAASTNLEQTVIKYSDQLTEIGKTVIQGVLGSMSALIQILASLIIAGVLLVFGGTGEAIRQFFRKLAGNRGDEFADVAFKTVGSVVKGIIGVALVLAIMHGIIFMLAGIPFAGIWTFLVFVLCVLQIPVIFVTLPIIIYLFAEQGVTTALIWTAVLFVAGLSDNVLKPLLLGKGAPVPMLVIFIGVIGGFIFSGFIGLFTGAIVLSLGYKLFISWLDSSGEIKPDESVQVKIDEVL